MRKIIIYGLSLIFFVLTVHALPSTIYAAESSPSANVREKLEELKKEIASKAAKLKQEVSQKLQNKAYIGTVKTKADSSITLATATGPKIVSINQDTIYESNKKTKAKFSLKTLAEEDYVATLGDADDGGVLTAKKIILLSSTPNQKKYFWGQINSISGRQLTLKDKEFKSFTVLVDTEAEIFEGKTSTNLADLKTNDFIILTGVLNKENVIEAEFVYIIPQGGILKPKKLATPSAKISTPSTKTTPR